MGIRFHPPVGSIVRVDLSEGFRPPEMVKRRPAVVLSPPLPGRSQLCVIVPLSTSEPLIVQAYHCLLELDPPLPFPYDNPRMWVKADMVLCVAFHRLKHLHHGKTHDGKRIPDLRIVNPEKMTEIKRCVQFALGLTD